MKTLQSIFKVVVAALLLCGIPTATRAQFMRSSYFMENVSFRQQLNPAQLPNRGYLTIPFIGAMNASFRSTSLGLTDIGDILDNSSSANYFLKDGFIGKLKANNQFNVNFNSDIIGVGWYKGKNFWNVNVGARVDLGIALPRRVFEFMRDMRGIRSLDWTNINYNASGEKVHLNSYIETGLGYSRIINERLTVGGKVKMLFGVANLDMNIRRLDIAASIRGISPTTDWSTLTTADLRRIRGEAHINVDASLESSMKGLGLEEKDGKINNIDKVGSFGIAGMGLGLDLGAVYKITKQFSVSASVIDLGFISWSKESTSVARSTITRNFDFNDISKLAAEDFKDIAINGEVLNYDMIQLKKEESKARSTSLYSTIVVGADYKLLDDKLTIGALTTTRFTKPETTTEFTLSGSYKVSKQIGFSLGYSLVSNAGSSIGLGMKLGPVFLGTDYIHFGGNARCINAMMGISVPLGKAKED